FVAQAPRDRGRSIEALRGGLERGRSDAFRTLGSPKMPECGATLHARELVVVRSRSPLLSAPRFTSPIPGSRRAPRSETSTSLGLEHPPDCISHHRFRTRIVLRGAKPRPLSVADGLRVLLRGTVTARRSPPPLAPRHRDRTPKSSATC